MSATLDADRFASYFGASERALPKGKGCMGGEAGKGGEGGEGGKGGKDGEGGKGGPAAPACPVLSIPGRTFPISDFFLEDAIERSGFMARGKVLRGPEAEAELLGVPVGGPEEEQEQGPADASDEATTYSDRTRQSLRRMVPGEVPAELVGALLSHLDAEDDAAGGPHGAALVFLPGVAEIRRLMQDLGKMQGAGRWYLLPLHGELPAAEQSKVFAPPPRGQRKVVLCTNVAETSLTVDDCCVVIDSGRMRSAQCDALSETSAATRLPRLQPVYPCCNPCTQAAAPCVHPSCSPVHPGCSPVHPGCSPVCAPRLQPRR